jgi:phosphate:Na+ symporter
MLNEIIFPAIGGLGFFFFGMKVMSDALKQMAGEKLKRILHSITNHRVAGVAVGTFITAVVQSSSAVTVMVVGFVNAGLLTLKQAISVIMGANIGTTLTAWIVSLTGTFKISDYALPCVGIGFAITAISKLKKNKSFGDFLLGFGMLFLGLSFMKTAFEPLQMSTATQDFMLIFSRNPLLGVLIGAFFTVILQSSSATIAILQVMAFKGLIGLDVAIPIILGDNIGTTITAQMASVGTNLNARRAAMSHTLFNVLGVSYMLPFVYNGSYIKFIDGLLPGQVTPTNIMAYIALSHTCFNLINTMIFLPLIRILERVSIFLVPRKGDSIDYGTQYLEKHLLDTPALALDQVYNETNYMLKIAKRAMNNAVEAFLENDLKKISVTIELEGVTDNLQSEITQYLVELSQRSLAPEDSQQLPVLIHNVNDIERIGDHAQDIAQLTKRKIEEQLKFSDLAISEIKKMREEVHNMIVDTMAAIKNSDIQIARHVIEREGRVNLLQEQFKQNHIKRLNDNMCNLNSGFIFLEVIDSLEKIGDRVVNIAESVVGKMKWEHVRKESDGRDYSEDNETHHEEHPMKPMK